MAKCKMFLLFQENHLLQETQDDLQAQVTTLQAQHGLEVIDNGIKPSLAKELTSLPFDEVSSDIISQMQFCINYKLIYKSFQL